MKYYHSALCLIIQNICFFVEITFVQRAQCLNTQLLSGMSIQFVIMYFLGPAKPGAIIESEFNGPAINISWNITGDLEYLSGEINDTTASPFTFNETLQQFPLTVANLSHGDKYTFKVTAHSNGFSSDPYPQTIRTTPTSQYMQ